jgi:hypothetical protein
MYNLYVGKYKNHYDILMTLFKIFIVIALYIELKNAYVRIVY